MKDRCLKDPSIFENDNDGMPFKTYQNMIDKGWTKFSGLSPKEVTFLFKWFFESFRRPIAIFSQSESTKYKKACDAIPKILRDSSRKFLSNQLQPALNLLNLLPLSNKKIINDVFTLARALHDNTGSNTLTDESIAMIVDNLLDATNRKFWTNPHDWLPEDEHGSYPLLIHIIKNYNNKKSSIHLEIGQIYFEESHGEAFLVKT